MDAIGITPMISEFLEATVPKYTVNHLWTINYYMVIQS